MSHLEFAVPSELYGQTMAVISNLSFTLKTGFAPCADETDYQMTSHELNQLESLSDISEFKSSNELPYPVKLIAACQPNGMRLELPKSFQLSAKEYNDVKTVLLNQGGKYSKNGFEFEEPAETIYWRIIEGDTLNRKKRFQFFATPAALASELVGMSELTNSKELSILEPSAGDGAIVREIINITHQSSIYGYELMELNCQKLSLIPEFVLLGNDFLESDDRKFDRIIANPPFSKNQDVTHILKMYDKLAENGVLVSVASQSWLIGKNGAAAKFKEFLSQVKAEINPVEPGMFKDSGTNVGTVIIKIRKGVF